MRATEIQQLSKRPERLRTRSLACYWTVTELGIPGTPAGRPAGYGAVGGEQGRSKRCHGGGEEGFQVSRMLKVVKSWAAHVGDVSGTLSLTSCAS